MTSDSRHPVAYSALTSLERASKLPRPRVLVVDDHNDTRCMFKVMLELRGLAVIEAENGEVAIELAVAVHPDLILMDALLPMIDGLTATELIRKQPALAEVPIIGISGVATAEFQAKAIQAGCNACLVKPIDFARFEELLDQFLIKSRTAAAHRAAQPQRSV